MDNNKTFTEFLVDFLLSDDVGCVVPSEYIKDNLTYSYVSYIFKLRVENEFILYAEQFYHRNSFKHTPKLEPFGLYMDDVKVFIATETGEVSRYVLYPLVELPENALVNGVHIYHLGIADNMLKNAQKEYFNSVLENTTINLDEIDSEDCNFASKSLEEDITKSLIMGDFESVRNEIMSYTPSFPNDIENDVKLFFRNPDAFCKNTFDRLLSYRKQALEDAYWRRKTGIEIYDKLVKDNNLMAKKALYELLEATNHKTYTVVVETDNKQRTLEFKVTYEELRRCSLLGYSISDFGPRIERELWEHLNFKQGVWDSRYICWHNLKEVSYRNKTLWKRSDFDE